MLIDHTNLRKTLQSFDKSRILEVFCNRNVNSVCSVFVFTQILKSELFKYQIEFKDMEKDINFLFKVDEREFLLKNTAENCTCHHRECSGIISLYKVLKSIDFVKIETIWPVAVCFSHYKIFLNENRYRNLSKECKLNNKENDKMNTDIPMNEIDPSKTNEITLCDSCSQIHDELFYSIRMLNNKSEGLLIQKRNRLDFLSESTLYRAMKNDLNFIHQKKLFYNKNGNVDRKIGEFLAKYGISINNAHTPYHSLDFMTKKHCNTVFGEEEKFIYKNGHDIEISAIEHSFLILFYLYKEKDMFSYMCLEKRKLIDLERVCRFHDKIVSVFKETTLNASKIGNLAIFRLKTHDFSIHQISQISYILYQFLRIYLIYKGDTDLIICLCFDIEDNVLLYSEDFDFSILRDVKSNVNENLVGIEKKKFSEIIRELTVNLE